MKNHLLKLATGLFCLCFFFADGQITDTTYYNYGIWQTFGEPVSKVTTPELQGRLCNFRWADLEIAPNVWNWVQFDSDLTSRANDSLPIIFMVYTKQDAPEWLYTNGVPKVTEKDANGNVTGYAPYYADTAYKTYFKRMITAVHQHLETLPAAVRNRIVGVQGCYGSTGDYISYKGSVDAPYQLTSAAFFSLFKEFSQYYYDEYKNSSPKIYLLSNPKNTGADQFNWLISNLPGSWVKCGSLGKGYQLNDEVSKAGWLYPVINSPQTGNYVRVRSEIIGDGLSSGWWLECPHKNMFAMLCYDIFWGLDWSNQSADLLNDPLYDSSFSFYNNYAGQKDPAQATNAMCALKDGLDASDSIRFPSAIYGTVTKSTGRFNKILQPFIAYGARLEDPATAILTESDNLTAAGINDVGWGTFSGNYDRYLHQLNANATSVGYWNIQSADTGSMYGRFGRGFDLSNGKGALYFDLDNAFLRGAPLNAQYPVMVEITYLDRGTGSFGLFYDGMDSANKPSITVNCKNTNLWKKASITLTDAYFGNRSVNGSDFYIKSIGNSNVVFSVVELTRPDANSHLPGYYVSSPLSFDTVCVNGTSAAKAFTLSGSFLTDSTTTVGPLRGFVFSTTPDSNYTDSINLSYGASFYQAIYVKFKPVAEGNYSGSLPIHGGGVTPVNAAISAVAINSSPLVTASVTNVSCNGLKNGSIDLALNGGIGPFSYNWINVNNANTGNEDQSNMLPGNYTVTVTSKGGCTKSSTYTITQPDSLLVGLAADSMICKGGTAHVYVNAKGGTLPYSGTGTFTVSAGINSFTVTDSNGCSDRRNITISNGTLTPPSKPASINSPNADASGLCGGGSFGFAVDPPSTATSFAWTLPAGASMVSANGDTSQITVSIPGNFIADSIGVSAKNVCGSSTFRNKIIYAIPAKPTGIDGTVNVTPSQTGVVYSVVQPVARLSYIWTVPPGTSITSGQNTSTITTNWGVKGGNVTVKAVNNCGTSASGYSLGVTVTTGLFVTSVSTLPQFDTVCVNSPSPAESFNLSASGLDGSDVTVGPAPGFAFASAANGTYSNSLAISGYGASISRSVFVKFIPSSTGNYNVNIPISGGSAAPTSVNALGFSLNSSPALSAVVTNISCKGIKDGAIDLSVTGGTGPFSYSWTGAGTYDSFNEDISGLSAANYTVVITSDKGCTISATYPITQPDALTVTISADSIICKGGTTTVHVKGNGGTLPYTGTGDLMGISAGTSSYTVTDAHGCSATESITVAKGNSTAPAKPTGISGTSDAAGLCGGGTFDFSIAAVANATSYTWTPSTGCSVGSTTADGTGITLNVPPGFSIGTLSVTANNTCGSSVASSKSLTSLPAKPGMISGPVNVTPSQSGLVYSVGAVTGLKYKWIVPKDAKVTSGQNTSTATVRWGITSGKISVKAINGCGNSVAASLSVTVSSKMFVASPASLVFDTMCVNSLSGAKSFTVSGAELDGSNIVIGPVAGFKVSLASTGTYTDSVVINGYGTSINQPIYVKFNPPSAATYDKNIVIKGGGAISTTVAASGTAVNSSPILSAIISNISCNGLKNGTIELTAAGGTGPISYSWNGPGTFDHAAQDITGLSASSYTITVTSYAGCTVAATYTVTQPDALSQSLSADSMICKGGTTTVHVNATGGTLPYTGTGDFAGVGAGSSTYTITDANGCIATKSISVANGTSIAPAKPAGIVGAADAKGLCGGGDFGYSVVAVANATSYNWTVPTGCNISNISSDGTSVTLHVPLNFSSGTLSVTANNACGTSKPATDALNALPGRSGTITGPSTVVTNQTGTVYSVPAVSGLNYLWALPAGAKIVAGANTNSITVNWGSNSGNVSCKAVNACGNSAASTISVSVAAAMKSKQNKLVEAIFEIEPLNAKLMPNPASTVVYVTFNASVEQKYAIEITSLSGKLLKYTDGIVYKGENKISLDVHNYANGVYMLTLITGKGERRTMKLVKE